MVVYDPVYYPTATGDADVVFQYNTVPLPRSPYMCGVQSGTVGVNYECGAVLPATTAGIAVNRAVRFSTGSGCQGSPSLVYSPASFTKSVPQNGTAADSLHICNNGVCPLELEPCLSSDYSNSGRARSSADCFAQCSQGSGGRKRSGYGQCGQDPCG